MTISSISHALSGPADRHADERLDIHADKLNVNRETALMRSLHMTLSASFSISILSTASAAHLASSLTWVAALDKRFE